MKRSYIEIVLICKSIMELSGLIGFGYDLSDSQDGIKCCRKGFILCGKDPLLLTKIQVSDQGPVCPLVTVHTCLQVFFIQIHDYM